MVTEGWETGRWYLVRHGETVWNRDGRIHGHVDAELNEHGRQQMRRMARRLADCRFSAAYASDLGRAVESARIIVEGYGVSVETDPDLREFSYGAWEGLTPEEAEAQDPEAYAERMALEPDAFAAPNGENTAQLLHRVRRFCERIVAHHEPSEDVLVVAHAGSIRALLVCLLGLPDDRFWRFTVDCGSLSVVRSHPDGRVLERWNEVPCASGGEGSEA
ncbi:MAG: histidine phosphatase family protein [Chloroflexi bacterium]|nr:histidine phosphatase family protein [Chloroflexota bacterium]